jgi:hypothetical protein
MATDIEVAFNQFLEKLRTTPSESDTAASHRSSIKSRLGIDFGMTAFFRTGSFGNGTNVPGHSDVDYFAVIPTDNLKRDSRFSLEAVAESLRKRFPLTPIRVDSPGVKVAFGLDGAEATEIVPVDATGSTKLGFRQFDMPDAYGGWKFSAPDSHNAYVTNIDKGLSGRVKPLVRLVKSWKYERNVPIKSFYLEIYTAKYASSEKAIVYDIDVRNVLTELHEAKLPDLADPRFPNDNFMISPCNTFLQREDALSKLGNAQKWAAEAVSLRLADKHQGAFDKWNLVFNYQFPAYF